MATAAARIISHTFSGDVSATLPFSAASNAASPGQIDLVTLASGANTITPPAGGSTPKAVTIIPPSGNTNTITLKGVTGDTGVVLHITDPTSIGLNSPTATFVLTASASIAGVRLVWC
jgi:hypothetical protein